MELKLLDASSKREAKSLLIAPYGIETTLRIMKRASSPSTNRTLWN